MRFAARSLITAGALLIAVGRLHSQQPQEAQNTTPRALPLSPKDILALLPAAPPGWKVTSSMATNQVTSWLVTIGQRQFEFSGTTPTQGASSKTNGPMRTTFMLMDTGYDGSAVGAFSDFKPMTQGNIQKLLYLGHPTIRMQTSDTRDSLKMLINGRFVLSVEVENQQKDAVLSWTQQISLEPYNIPRGAVLTKLPPKVIIATVDELNPRNSRESTTDIGEHVRAQP